MKTGCPHIDQAIRFALLTANRVYKTVERTAENQNKVIWMADPLIPSLKKDIEEECSGLNYWEFEGGGHNPSTNGYKCEECRVVLVFPTTKTPTISSK